MIKVKLKPGTKITSTVHNVGPGGKKTLSSVHTDTVKEETLTEVSKKLLKSYIKKASHDVATKSAAVGRYADRANRVRDEIKKGDYGNYQQGKKDDEFADKMFKKSWKRRKNIEKAVDKLEETSLNKEDYDLVSKRKSKAAEGAARGLDKLNKSMLRPFDDFVKDVKGFRKDAKRLKRKAVTGLDEANKTPSRVVTASKKAVKGTKWRVMSRNPDSEGSEMELRQGKRKKLTGYYDRVAGDFHMSKTKKGKIDMKDRGKSYDTAKDILKTVKEENINEVSKGLLKKYIDKANPDHERADLSYHYTGNEKSMAKRNRRGKGLMVARRKTNQAYSWDSGKAKVLAKEETLNEISKKVLKSYVKKASVEADPFHKKSLWWKTKHFDSKTANKISNRETGIKRAENRLSGTSLVKKKYVGEANEPFDPPFVQKGKEKSNPDRRANTLSHKALKAVKKKLNKDKAKKKNLAEISSVMANNAYHKAKEEGQFHDKMTGLTNKWPKESKKWAKRADKKWAQARKFADYADKKMDEMKVDQGSIHKAIDRRMKAKTDIDKNMKQVMKLGKWAKDRRSRNPVKSSRAAEQDDPKWREDMQKRMDKDSKGN